MRRESKTWTLGTCVVCILCLFGNAAFATPVITDGLVAGYEFNGNADDITGNGHNGVVYGATPVADRSGRPDSAFGFNGTSDWISLEGVTDSAFSFHSFSISVWFRTQTNKYQTLIHGSDGSQWGLTGYQIKLESLADVATTFRAVYSGDSNGMHSYLPIDSSWHNVVLVRDTAAGMGRMYYDGVLADLRPDSDPSVLLVPQSYVRFATEPEGEVTHWFDGAMDDIYFYNRALSSEEVAQLAAPEPATIALLALGTLVAARRRRA